MKISREFRDYLLLVILSISLTGLGFLAGKAENDPVEAVYIDTCLCNTDTLTLDNVLREIKRQEIKFPEVVLRQCILETGYLKSNICKKYNNLFGFYYISDYLKFNNWKESIAYYKKFQDAKYKGGNYYHFLDRLPYAEDSLYTQSLKNIKLDI